MDVEKVLKVAQFGVGVVALGALAADAAMDSWSFGEMVTGMLLFCAGWVLKRPSDLAHKPAAE